MIKDKNKKPGIGFLCKEPFLILAVMLALILVLAPFYSRYLKQSHLASDKRLAADIRTAMAEAGGDPDVPGGPGPGAGTALEPLRIGELPDGTESEEEGYWAAVWGKLGARGPEDLEGQLKYDEGGLWYYTDSDGNVFVVVDYVSRTDFVMPGM